MQPSRPATRPLPPPSSLPAAPAVGFLALLIAMLVAAGPAHAELRVVASIKPVHSLVAAVMAGVGDPSVIIDGAGSPHAYALKPSQARDIEQADMVFWIGHRLETFLEKPIGTLATGAAIVELAEAEGLTRLEPRRGGAFEADIHEDGEHGEADSHADEAGHGEFDTHLWLDPLNARAMMAGIARALAQADPANAPRYQANAQAAMSRIDALAADIAVLLEPVRGRAFIVFHDAYHYFENRFAFPAAGSITVSPDIMPGAGRIAEIRAKVKESGAVCVFSEPQFEPGLIEVVTEGTGARAATLDPLGASLAPGPDLYFELLRNLAISLRDCLGAAG